MKLTRTRTTSTLLAICSVAALNCGLLSGQQVNQTAPQSSTLKSTAEEVVLDVVVRDKKGRPIKDLSAEDFHVVDNGTKQTIKGFRLVEGTEAIEKGSKVPLDPLRQLRLVTVAFAGSMSQDGKRNAMKAVNELISGAEAQNEFYAVVLINNSLTVLQPFTKDKEALKKAAEHAIAGLSSAKYIAESQGIKNQLRSILGPDNGQSMRAQITAMQGQTSATPANTAPDVGNIVNAKMAQVMLDMLQFDETMTGDEWDRLKIFSLLSLVRGQMTLPGRKTLLYITEGMHVPDFLEEAFRNITSAANRANVSIYPIDPRGVTADASGTEMLKNAIDASGAQQTADGGAVTKDQVRSMDNAISGMRANDRMPLQDLANGTGGVFISQTNDLRGHLRRINEDINSYYEISYVPGIENYDGSFRKTAVTVDRKDLKLQTRNGYFALPMLDPSQPTLQPFEVPLLKALDGQPLPKDIDFRAGALHLKPSTTGMVHGAVLIEVPLKGIKFDIAPSPGTTYKVRISMVSLLKDANNTVVKKWTRDVPLQGPADKVPQIQLGNFVYKEQFDVPAGKYTLETAVIDRQADKIGAKKAVFVAPAQPQGVQISNIALVRRYEPNVKDLDPNDPFQFQGGRVTPTLNSTIKAEKGSVLSMFFIVYPDPAIKDKATITLEYLKDGQPIGRGEVPLPAADANGRIPYVMSSPADAMPAGGYEIRAIAKQGNTTSQESTAITVE